MIGDVRQQHASFRQGVRGAVVAQMFFEPDRKREAGWRQVRESWMRLERNGKPTPWDQLVGPTAARNGRQADLTIPPGSKTGCGGSSADSVPPKRSRARRTGVERVYIDDSHYYYALGPGIQTPQLLQRGVYIWRYDGQQIFSDATQPPSGGRWVLPPSPQVPTAQHDIDESFGVGRDVATDHLGRRWVAHAIDRSALEERLRRYDERVYAQFGRSEGNNRVAPNRKMVVPPQDDSDGQARFVNLDTMYYELCDNFINSDYPMAEQKGALNDRGRKVVNVRTPWGSSGTMIDDRHILTTAHSLTHQDGGYIPTDDIWVCTYGNCSQSSPHQYEVACYPTGWSHVRSAALSAGEDVATDWDYGILTLCDVLEGKYTFGWMALESDEWYLGKVPDHHRGYAGNKSDCNANTDCTNRVETGEYAAWQMYAYGDVLSVWSGQVEFNTSSGHGMSGGPHYNCPTGDCDEGHYLTAVHSSHRHWYSQGPKATAFRSWVVGSYAFNYEDDASLYAADCD